MVRVQVGGSQGRITISSQILQFSISKAPDVRYCEISDPVGYGALTHSVALPKSHVLELDEFSISTKLYSSIASCVDVKVIGNSL